jgi:hypothetical protein
MGKGEGHPHDMPMQAQREGGGTAATHSQSRRQKGVGCQHYFPAILPPTKSLNAFYKRLGLPRRQSGRAWNVSPEFDPRIVHPVTSPYTEYDIPATEVICTSGLVARTEKFSETH